MGLRKFNSKIGHKIQIKQVILPMMYFVDTIQEIFTATKPVATANKMTYVTVLLKIWLTEKMKKQRIGTIPKSVQYLVPDFGRSDKIHNFLEIHNLIYSELFSKDSNIWRKTE